MVSGPTPDDDASTAIICLPCPHVFNASCLAPFSKSKRTTFPTCRFDLDLKNAPDNTPPQRRSRPTAATTAVGVDPTINMLDGERKVGSRTRVVKSTGLSVARFFEELENYKGKHGRKGRRCNTFEVDLLPLSRPGWIGPCPQPFGEYPCPVFERALWSRLRVRWFPQSSFEVRLVTFSPPRSVFSVNSSWYMNRLPSPSLHYRLWFHDLRSFTSTLSFDHHTRWFIPPLF